MKRVTKKTAPSKTKKKSLLSKMKRPRGVVDAGTVYGIILLGIVVGGGLLMLGNSSPKLESPNQNQPVIIQKSDTSEEDNLQLEDFPGITLTPTPSPSPTPTPTPTPKPPSTGGGGGGGKGGSCFPAGTMIRMADNSVKPIEDVKVGDMVLGFDGEQQVAERVQTLESPVRDHLYVLTFSDGTTLELTREHPLYTAEGWKSLSPEETADENPQLHVATLAAGDKVLNDNGTYVTLESVEYKPGTVQTYNLKSVSGENNYYADGKLAHNKGGGGGGGGGGGSAL
jgi:hypothetical protein